MLPSFRAFSFVRSAKSNQSASAYPPRWPVLIAAIILGVMVAAAAAGYLASQREDTLRDTERELQNLSLVLANWVDDGFHSVEQLEIGVADWVHSEGIVDPEEFYPRLATRDVHERLRLRIAAVPRVSRLFLVDLAGRNVANTVSFPAPAINSVGRDYFDELLAGAGDTFLSSPLRNKIDGNWSIFISHRVRSPDGHLVGVVAGGIDLAYFENMFARLALGANSPVSLVRRDGTLLARFPHHETAIGTSVAGAQTFKRVLAFSDNGTIRSASPLDGVERIQAVRALEHYPLVVVATRSIDDVLVPWRAEAGRVAVAVLLLEVSILFGAVLATSLVQGKRSMRQLTTARIEAERELERAREREAAAEVLAERDAALRAVFETATAGITEFDVASARYVRVNKRFCDMLGRSEVELLTMGPPDVVYPGDGMAANPRWREQIETQESWDAEVRYVRPDGEVVWAHISVAASLRDDDGKPLRCVSIIQDITESRLSAERLRANEELLRLGMQVGHIGAFRSDLARDGQIHCGAETRLLHGLPPGNEPMSQETWMATLLPEDAARLRSEIADARARGAPEIAYHYRFRHPHSGEVRHIEGRARYRYDAAGQPLSLIGVIIDVTERVAAEAIARLCLEAGGIGNVRYDFRTGTVTAGAETRAMYGLPPDDGEPSGMDWLAVVVPEDREHVRVEFERVAAARQSHSRVEYRIQRPSDGEIRHFEARTRYDYDAEGRPLSALGVVIDVTERKVAEARIAHMAHHDALTGLPNRVLFRSRLDEALARAQRGEGFAVLCLDLDRFKEVNDTLGHPMGDALLKEVTERLKTALRETDTLARLGGDEFAIIQSSVNQASETARLARRVVEIVATPFELDGHQAVVGTSIGIAIAPDDGLGAADLLKAADMALYRAKADGRGCWRFFEVEMNAQMQARRRLEWDLRRALEAEEFELFYQPIINVGSRKVTGMEALVRWRHPDGSLVGPDRFIPTCEDVGLIVPLGTWVLSRACSEAVTWPETPWVAVNLSPAQFASGSLVDAVAAALRTSGLEPHRLELEITETVMLQNTEMTLATLHRLRALGVQIAMDDFGTGYSSLSYLQRFPFDKVKIDQCFTSGLDKSPQSDAIVGAVTNLCEGLHMRTTAEGVETEEQFQALARKGCTEAQGYLFSRPVPAGQVPELIARLDRASGAHPTLGALVERRQ